MPTPSHQPALTRTSVAAKPLQLTRSSTSPIHCMGEVDDRRRLGCLQIEADGSVWATNGVIMAAYRPAPGAKASTQPVCVPAMAAAQAAGWALDESHGVVSIQRTDDRVEISTSRDYAVTANESAPPEINKQNIFDAEPQSDVRTVLLGIPVLRAMLETAQQAQEGPLGKSGIALSIGEDPRGLITATAKCSDGGQLKFWLMPMRPGPEVTR